jgi:hypothetical protein
MADEATEFWDTFEKETGEKVEARSIGEWYEEGDKRPGVWGLLVLTDKAFRFRHMPSDNWLTSLFRRADKAKRDQALDIVLTRELVSAVIVPKRSFLGKLFGPAFPRFAVKTQEAEGEKHYVFSADPTNGFITAIEKAFPAAEG